MQTFLNELWLATQLDHSFKRVTTDGRQAARNAFSALNSETQLAECLLHPFLKFKDTVHQWAKLTKASADQVQLLTQLCYGVLFAPDAATFEQRLKALADYPMSRVEVR